MGDLYGVPVDGPGRCEFPGCTEPGTEDGMCPEHAGLPTVEQAQAEHDRNVRRINAGETYPAHKPATWHRRTL